MTLQEQINNQIKKVNRLMSLLERSREKNITNPQSLQSLYQQYSAEQAELANLQLQNLNQK